MPLFSAPLATPVAVANGGTGIASGTSGGVLAYTATGTLASSGALTAGELVRGGGAGAAPSTSGSATVSQNGAVSAPPVSLTGTWFSGGSATTTKPQLLVEPAGTTSTSWSTSGTGIGINAPSGFGGNIFDAQLNGLTRASVRSDGRFAASFLEATGDGLFLPTFAGNVNIRWASGAVIFGSDTTISRPAAATIQLGAAASASPVAQTLQSQGSRGGTDSNVGGGNLTITSGAGTGTGTRSALILRSPLAAASGTTQQTQATGLTIINGCARRTSYTVATLPASPTQGDECNVTDASAPTWNATLTGGGAVFCGARYNGTAWVAF